MEVWWTGANGEVLDAFWSSNSGWNHFQFADSGTASLYGGIAAARSGPNRMELLWFDNTNSVVEGDNWTAPVTLSVRATATAWGPDVCVSGTGFNPGDTVYTRFFNIPGRPAQTGDPGSVDSTGEFSVFDTSQERSNLFCSDSQKGQTVTVWASDKSHTGSTTLPGNLWCANTALIDYNGGCRR